MEVGSVGIAGTGVSIGQVEGMAAGLDKLAGTVSGALSPTAGLVDTIGSAIGLPDAIKQIAKIAVGIGTGDVLGVVSGAFGLAGDAMEALAATQYHPSTDPAKCGCGYAESTPAAQCHYPTPPPGCGTPPPDSDLVRERHALQTLLQDFDAVDNAGGLWFRDGKFSGLDMNAVMNGDFPPEMKQAVRYFQEHPEKYCRMDRGDGFDGLVTRGGLQQELCRVNSQLDAQGGAPAAGEVPPSSTPAPELEGGSLESCALSKLGDAQGEVNRLMQEATEHPDDKQLQLQLQQAQERMQALFTMLSDMFKTNHDLQMQALKNAV